MTQRSWKPKAEQLDQARVGREISQLTSTGHHLAQQAAFTSDVQWMRISKCRLCEGSQN